jgi:hypothetical protein
MSGIPPLVALILSQPRMADTLAAKHADDGHGCCRTCSGGAQSGRFRFPCTIMQAVIEARRRSQVPA